MSQVKSILIYGFALFAMFFGSGNLVFPIKIGLLSGSYWFYGFIGLFITGIILPFLGLFVVKLHKGDYNAFFGQAGFIAKIILPLFTLSLLGSFAVVPRCISVAHGGMLYIAPQLSLEIFSLVFCIIIFCLCLKEQRMMKIMGKWMAPILLVALGVMIIAGFISANVITKLPNNNAKSSFYEGFLTGYQTMDLFAAFFFSAIMFAQIQNLLPKDTAVKDIKKFFIKSSLIGASLLGVIYFGFVFLGAHFSYLLQNIEPELMLPVIAKHIIGEQASIFISIAMVLSCLTTAVALNNIYARYIFSLLRIKENKFFIVLIITTFISYFISLFDFKGIAAFLGPALQISYPSIIILTIFSIATKKYHKAKIIIFYSVLFLNFFIFLN